MKKYNKERLSKKSINKENINEKSYEVDIDGEFLEAISNNGFEGFLLNIESFAACFEF